jgi:Family of unknown function (DUF5670)
MLWILAGIEVVLWIYAMASHHRLGGVIHWLLVLAAVAVLTELGLRYRRSRKLVQPGRKQEHSADWRRAA